MNVWLWILSAAGGITVLYAAGSALLRSVRALFSFVRRVVHFLDDWLGDGKQPGVMDRMAEIENQLKTNGGKTLRDRVDHLHQKSDENELRLIRIEKYLGTSESDSL